MPLILLKVAFTPKYRKTLIGRLGFGIKSVPPGKKRARIWIHALSVGEVASSVSFVKELRKRLPNAVLIFSTTTLTGRESASAKLRKEVDCFITMPLDFWYAVRKVIKAIRPDIFILVETDFWPNLLCQLNRKNCDIILLNGRISDSSLKSYKRFRFFFAPMFARINFFAMQSADDETKIISLGVPPKKVYRIGNLKFDQDSISPQKQTELIQKICSVLTADPTRKVFIAGSTHKGEEEIIFDAFSQAVSEYPQLFLIIAPRNIDEAGSVLESARSKGLRAFRRTRFAPDLIGSSQIMVLDTLGELSYLYSVALVCFVGGSLVAHRGHNILEPAAYGKPVLFGPHIEDFQEAAQGLLAGGGFLVQDADSLADKLKQFLINEELSSAEGEKAKDFVEKNKGAVKRALDLVLAILEFKSKPVIH